MSNRSRPLSPFVGIYRWRYTFLNPSIMHRMSGLLLTFGLCVLVYFLWAAASGIRGFARALAMLASPWLCPLYFAWAWSFFYHLLAGVRHLVLDAGFWLERKPARTTAQIVVVGSFVLAIALLCLIAVRFGRA